MYCQSVSKDSISIFAKLNFFVATIYILFSLFYKLSLRNVCYYIFFFHRKLLKLTFQFAVRKFVFILHESQMCRCIVNANGLEIFSDAKKKDSKTFSVIYDLKNRAILSRFHKFRYFFVAEIEINHFNGETNISLLEIDFSTFIYSLRCYTTSNRIILRKNCSGKSTTYAWSCSLRTVSFRKGRNCPNKQFFYVT